MSITITPLVNSPLGAFVSNWQPESPLGRDETELVVGGLRTYRVLIFRGQRQPTDSELIDFVTNFGSPIKGSQWFRTSSSRPEILPVTNMRDSDGLNEGVEGATDLEWHADYSYVQTPGHTSFLNAVTLPSEPPQTHFCDMYAAFATLKPALQNRLRPLRAVHSIADYMNSPELDLQAKIDRDQALGVTRPDIPEAEHPVVVTHPDTGHEILYVSKGITRHIVGMDRAESSTLLKQLHLHATKPEAVYSHDWQIGDLVVFDTLGTMHRRDSWDPAQPRLMRQLSTACSLGA